MPDPIQEIQQSLEQGLQALVAASSDETCVRCLDLTVQLHDAQDELEFMDSMMEESDAILLDGSLLDAQIVGKLKALYGTE